MKYSRLRGGTSHEVRGINISPLIDMVFILLIFFIVAAVFVEEPEFKFGAPKQLQLETLKKTVSYWRLPQTKKCITVETPLALMG